MFGRDRIEYKTVEQVRVMRRAGLVVADALDAAQAAAVAGATTAAVDAAARAVIEAAGATSNFLGYGHPPFPAVTCVSVNDEVVHGIPGPRVLADGDLVSIDCGAVVADDAGTGWHGDAAVTVVVGGPQAADPLDVELSATTEASLWAGVAALAGARHLGEVGAAVEDVVGERFGILDGYTGHGIGTAMHQAPEVLNHRTRDRGPKVRPGLVRGDRADVRARLRRLRPGPGRLDRGVRRRRPRGALGAHRGRARGRHLGAHRPRRRRGRPGPARGRPRPALSRRRSDRSAHDDFVLRGGMT